MERGIMKSIYADLVDDVVSSYDQTKTTIQGRITSKTINSNTVLGPPLNKFADVFTDAAITPAAICHLTENGRLFTMTTATAGLATLALYNFTFATGALSYVGKLNISFPNSAATTHTLRAMKVIDTGTTSWKIFFATVGSVVINGGLFMAQKIDLADFVPIGFATIPLATTSDAKAVYDLQDPVFLGANHTAANVKHVAAAGMVLDRTNSRLYLHNGVAATHQYHVFDTSAVPTITSRTGITGVAATDVISDAGHPFINGDQIQFTSITGGTGLTASTVYFVVTAVAGVSYQLSLTSGGAAINFTTDISAGTVIRSFGITGSNYLHSTGNLPVLTGTLLLTDSEDFATPASVNVSVDGFSCAFFGTTTNMYLGRLSELTAAAVTWPSLQTCNLLGTANQITAPTAVQVAWSNVLNKAVYTTNTSIFVMKSFVNNSIDKLFGGLGNRYIETLVNHNTVELQMVTVGGIDLEQGWLAVLGTTIGQRGIYLHDIRSEPDFDYSYIVTKVLDTPQSTMKFITTLDELYDYTGALEVYYRTSGFGSISGGWTAIPFAEDLSGFTPGDQTQFKILFATEGLDTSIPAQLNEFILGYESLNENSEHWQVSKDLSSTGATHKVVWYLADAYTSTVPTLYARAYQQGTTTSVGSGNTSANPTQFRYSTNGGTSWTALGTIPNTVGTLVEWTPSVTPSVDYLPSLRES